MSEQTTTPGGNAKALLATISGFFMLALVSVLVKLQQQGGASIEWIVFVQFSTCLLIITIIISKHKFRDLKTNKKELHLVRGVTGVLAFTCSAIAMSKIPLVNAVLLNNTAPLFIPLITGIFLKAKIDKKIWWGIIVGFTGVIFILRPHERDLIKTGDIYGLASGIFLAIAFVTLKVLSKTESFVTVMFYYSFISFLLSLPFAIFNWSNPPLLIWMYGVLAGTLFISYMYLLQYAYRFMDAVSLAPFNYSVIVFTGIIDWLIFKNVPDTYSVIGIILVTAGGLLAIMLHEKNNTELKHNWNS